MNFKRIIAATVLTFVLGAGASFAALDNIPVAMAGKLIDFPNAKPFVDAKDRTQTPARYIGEALGAEVDWNDAEQKAIFRKDDILLEFYINRSDYYINGEKFVMDTEATIKNERTFVPVRFIAEGLGAEVTWDNEKNMVNILPQTEVSEVVEVIDATSNQNVKPTENETAISIKMDLHSKEIYYGNWLLDLEKFAERPVTIDDQLLIPAKYLAMVLNGSYTQDDKNKTAELMVDGTTFKFEFFSDAVVIGNKKATMATEAFVKNYVLSIPLSVLVDNMPNYKVTIFENKAFMIERKDIDYKRDLDKIPYLYQEYVSEYYEEKSRVFSDETAKKVDQIIAKIITADMTELDKVLAVNNYVVKNLDYVATFKDVDTVFETGITSCTGYANMTSVLLNAIGIENTFVVGYSGVDTAEDFNKYVLLDYEKSNHAWNLVKVDGKDYHLDTTWNDPASNGVQESSEDRSIDLYNYCLLSDKEIGKDHIWIDALYDKADSSYVGSINDTYTTGLDVTISYDGDDTLLEDVYMTMSGTNQWNSWQRVILLEKGEKTKNFKMPINNKYAHTLESLSAQIVEVYNHKYSEVYEVASVKNGNSLKITLKKLKSKESALKVKIDGAVVEDETIYLRMYKMTRNGNRDSYSVIGFETTPVSIKKGNTEAVFKFLDESQDDNYYYTFDITTAKGTYYVKADGTLTSENVKLNAREVDYHDLDIVLDSKYLKDKVVKEVRGTTYSNEVFDEIKALLLASNVGNHEVMSTLKTPEDGRTMEGKAPNETDGKGTLYYVDYFKSKAYVYRVYSKDTTRNSVSYSVTLNDLILAKDDYYIFYDQMNDLIRNDPKMILSDQSYVLDTSNYNRDPISYEDYDKDELYDLLMAERRQVGYTYTQDNVVYQVDMHGSRHYNSIRVSISTTVNLDLNKGLQKF